MSHILSVIHMTLQSTVTGLQLVTKNTWIILKKIFMLVKNTLTPPPPPDNGRKDLNYAFHQCLMNMAAVKQP